MECSYITENQFEQNLFGDNNTYTIEQLALDFMGFDELLQESKASAAGGSDLQKITGTEMVEVP